MVDTCYCDYGELPDVYSAKVHTARTPHRCHECDKPINAGEKYERAAMLYEGRWDVCATCFRCLDLRQYVEAHAPCFCWAHGNMVDEAQEVIQEYAHHSVGFFIGATKRLIRVTGRRPWA